MALFANFLKLVIGLKCFFAEDALLGRFFFKFYFSWGRFNIGRCLGLLFFTIPIVLDYVLLNLANMAYKNIWLNLSALYKLVPALKASPFWFILDLSYRNCLLLFLSFFTSFTDIATRGIRLLGALHRWDIKRISQYYLTLCTC